VLASNQAVRLGLRAASRNPEFAFGRALIDQAGALLSLLPIVLAGLLIGGVDLGSILAAAGALRWPVLGAIVAAFAVSLTAGALFWAGALPLLAADIELGRRPPPGNFALLAARGFARVLLTALTSQLLSTLATAGCVLAVFVALPMAALKPSTGSFAGVALVVAVALVSSLLIDLLARFWLLRAAAFGDGVSASFGKAASLLSARLGQGLVVSAAFLVLELIVSAVAGGLSGAFSGMTFLNPEAALFGLAPRVALGLAFSAVFAWLEVGRMGALAAIACDAEALLGPDHGGQIPEPVPEEGVIEAQPVVEALPLDD
jgi:hypothetical protein